MGRIVGVGDAPPGGFRADTFIDATGCVVAPGLIDLSTRESGAERALLAGLEGEALEEAYVEKVLPRRLELGKRYVEGRGFWMDLRILGCWLAGPLLR